MPTLSSRATDAEVGQMAKSLPPQRLRKMLENPDTPAERLRLAAFLLGGCGRAEDADLILSLLKSDSERSHAALGGLLAGYVVLRPADGWKLAAAIVADPKAHFWIAMPYSARCAFSEVGSRAKMAK